MGCAGRGIRLDSTRDPRSLAAKARRVAELGLHRRVCGISKDFEVVLACWPPGYCIRCGIRSPYGHERCCWHGSPDHLPPPRRCRWTCFPGAPVLIVDLDVQGVLTEISFESARQRRLSNRHHPRICQVWLRGGALAEPEKSTNCFQFSRGPPLAQQSSQSIPKYLHPPFSPLLFAFVLR